MALEHVYGPPRWVPGHEGGPVWDPHHQGFGEDRECNPNLFAATSGAGALTLDSVSNYTSGVGYIYAAPTTSPRPLLHPSEVFFVNSLPAWVDFGRRQLYPPIGSSVLVSLAPSLLSGLHPRLNVCILVSSAGSFADSCILAPTAKGRSIRGNIS